jgi:hypothetical protein
MTMVKSCSARVSMLLRTASIPAMTARGFSLVQAQEKRRELTDVDVSILELLHHLLALLQRSLVDGDLEVPPLRREDQRCTATRRGRNSLLGTPSPSCGRHWRDRR